MKKIFIFIIIIMSITVLLSGCSTSEDPYVFEFDLNKNMYYSVFIIDTDNAVNKFSHMSSSLDRALTENEQNELNTLLSESELREVKINDSIIGDGMYFEINGDNVLLLGSENQLYCNIKNTTYLVVKDLDVRDYIINKYFDRTIKSYAKRYDELIDYDNKLMLFNRYFYAFDNTEDLEFINSEKSYTKEIDEDEALEIAKKEIDKNPYHKYNEFTVYRDIKNEYYGVLAAQENVLDYEEFIVMDKYGNLIYTK